MDRLPASGRDLLPRAIQRSRVLIVPAYEGCDVAVVDRPEEILRRSVGEAEDAACGLPVEAVRSRRQRGLGATVRAAVRRRAELRFVVIEEGVEGRPIAEMEGAEAVGRLC